MALNPLIKRRMKKLIYGSGGWEGGVAYAKRITSKRSSPTNTRNYTSPSAPGEPPASRSGTLTRSIRGKVRTLFGKSIQGEIFSTATYRGQPYPLFQELGSGDHYKHPWLKPTFDRMVRKGNAIFSKRLDRREQAMLKDATTKKRMRFDNQPITVASIII